MELTPFKYYRLLIKKNAQGNDGYFSLNTLSMYEQISGGVDLCLASSGSIATASNNIDATSDASKAIDANASTYWETSNTSGEKWIMIQFPTAKIVRRMVLTTTTYQDEMPSIFDLQGSNDGTTWTNIKSVSRGIFTGITSFTELLSVVIGGVSKLDSGNPTLKVILYTWSTMQYLAQTTPDINGNWFFWLNTNDPLMVVHIGPSGYQPISDGPVTPMEY